MLAVCWAVSKCKLFLTGLQHFTIITDHNPLIPILNNHRLDEIENSRFQRLKTRLMAYNFTAQWLKSANNNAPDALSCHPVCDPQPTETLAEIDIHNNPEMSFTELCTITDTQSESLCLQELRKHAEQVEEYQLLRTFILNGFPRHRKQLPESCRRYCNIHQQLTVDDDLIVYGCRLLIPSRMRHQVLTNLHEAHQRVLQTKQCSCLTIYWPGLDNDIDNIILNCQQCQDHLPSNNKEQKPRPFQPFQEVAMDLCSYTGQDYLVMVDCHTDWPDIIPMTRNTTTSQITTALRQAFCRTAIPDIVWSDGGPQFTSNKFTQFALQWGFHHNTACPHYPQSNGKVESTVKSMKKIIYTSWNGCSLDHNMFCPTLLQYRNTPSCKDGLYPAQNLFGYPVQNILPAHRHSFSQEWQRKTEAAEQQAEAMQQSSATYYNLHAHPLTEIELAPMLLFKIPVPNFEIFMALLQLYHLTANITSKHPAAGC